MKKLIVITGGTSGLGKTLATLLTPEYRVFVIARKQEAINKISESMEIDVLPYGIYNWKDYMYILSQYRFILSPYSNDSNTFHLKFYEALLVDSIPIHQIHGNTLEYYSKEALYPDVIYFQDPSEVADKVNNFKLDRSSTKPWLEDELASFFLEHNIKIDKNEYN